MKYLFIISLLLFVSCKKERTFHITAKNAATGEPYPGLSFEIQRSWSGAFENHYKSVGSGFLNENGEVYFTKRLHKNSSYSISVAPPPNTCYISDTDLHPGGETNFKAEFEFAECAYMKLRIHNVNCEGNTDTMRFRSKYSYDTKWQGWATNRIGCYNFDSPYPFEVAEGWRIYEWQVKRSGIISTYIDSIYLDKGVNNGIFQMNY